MTRERRKVFLEKQNQEVTALGLLPPFKSQLQNGHVTSAFGHTELRSSQSCEKILDYVDCFQINQDTFLVPGYFQVPGYFHAIEVPGYFQAIERNSTLEEYFCFHE